MSDAKGREPQFADKSNRTAAETGLESVDSAFAAAVEPELPASEPMSLATAVATTEVPRASGRSHAVFLLGGVGLAMLGGLMLRGNEDVSGTLAALRRDADVAAAQVELRLKAAEARALAAGDAAAKGQDAQNKTLAVLDKRVKELEQAPASVPAAVAAPVDLSGLVGGIAALEAKFAALGGRISSLDGKIGVVEAQLATPKTPLQATQDKIAPPPPATANMAAQLVLAQGIQGALERGAPFAAEIAALQTLGVEAARLGPLAEMAAKGAPSQAVLAAEWKKLAPTLLSATAPETPKTQNLMERLSSGAASLVTVRRDTDPPGDNVAGAIAAVDAAQASGDIAAMDAAFAKLPAKAQDLAKDWLALAKNRAGGVEAARALVADAIARLAAKKG